MVCLRYAESENNPFIGTRQTGSCSYTGILWPDFRQRGDTFCSEQGMAGDTPFTQTAFKGLASIPIAEARGFTLDLVNVCRTNIHSFCISPLRATRPG